MGSTIDADDGDRAFAGDAQHSAGREVYAAVAADSTAFPNANAAAATGASAAAAKGTPTLASGCNPSLDLALKRRLSRHAAAATPGTERVLRRVNEERLVHCP